MVQDTLGPAQLSKPWYLVHGDGFPLVHAGSPKQTENAFTAERQCWLHLSRVWSCMGPSRGCRRGVATTRANSSTACSQSGSWSWRAQLPWAQRKQANKRQPVPSAAYSVACSRDGFLKSSLHTWRDRPATPVSAPAQFPCAAQDQQMKPVDKISVVES